MSIKFISVKDIESQFGQLSFGNLLKSFRLGEELSQVALAKKLNCSKQMLNDIESGRKIPSISKTHRIAKKIGILPELAIELLLQDHINRENLRMIVKVQSKRTSAA